MENNTNPGFISIDQAIDLIKSHTHEKQVVDLLFLNDNIHRIRKGRNFTIFRVKKVTDPKTGSEKYTRDYPQLTVAVTNEEDQVDLRRAVREKIEEVTGKKFGNIADIGLRKVTNTVDDQYGTTARPRANIDSKIKLGDTINSGSALTSNKL